MLEIHDVAGLPLGRDPGVDPCRKGLEKTSCLVTWPNHINSNFLTELVIMPELRDHLRLLVEQDHLRCRQDVNVSVTHTCKIDVPIA